MTDQQQPTPAPTIWQRLGRLNPPLAVRRWAYGVTAAGLALGGVYGYLDGEQLAAWLVLGGAVLGVAAGNSRAPK